jgi:succinoglycan biosynthesis transport protein ExoP
MASSAHPSPDNIDVAHILGAVARKWRSLISLTLGAGLITFAGLMLVKPTYVSEAEIAIVARGDANPYADPKSAPGGESVAVRMDREAINTHARALQAPELAQRISQDLKLARLPEFNPAAGTNGVYDALGRLAGIGKPRAGESDEDRVLAAFARKLSVTATKDSRTIAIRVSSHDKDLASDIANRLGEAYRERLAARTVNENNDVQRGLQPRIDRLALEVAENEREVERFRGSANIFRSGSNSSSLNDQQLGEMTAAESKARTEYGEAEARARAARELAARGSAEVHPDVQKSPVLQKLVQDRARIEGDVAKATATMKEGHPALKQLRSELASTEKQINLEVKRAIDGLEKEVGVASLRLASAQRSLAEVKARVVNTGGDQARLSQLEANAKAKRGELERLQSQFEANRARSDARIVPVEAQVISVARAAAAPSFPKPLAYSGLAMLATLLLSASVMIARKLIRGARKPGGSVLPASGAVEVVEPQSSAPALAVAQGADPRAHEPKLPTPARFDHAGGTGPAPAHAPLTASDQVDSVAALAGRLLAKKGAQNGVRTLLAGASVGVDPGAEAVELARAMARSGQSVLLVDWSLDGAGVARLLGLPVSPGMGELIDGRTGFEGAIGRLPGSAAHLIASGAGLLAATGRGDADRLNLLLDTLDEIYGHIIVAARFNAARDLFETIEGRFDAGVLIGDTMRRAHVLERQAKTFLGFEVEGLDVIRLARLGAGGRLRPEGHAA